MTTESTARRLGSAAWAACGVALLVALVARNPPLTHAAIRMLPLAAALGVLLALCGLGLPLARRLAPGADAVITWLVAAPLGMGLTSAFVLALGVAGAFEPIAFAAWFLAGLGSAAHDLVRRRPWRLPRFSPGPWDVLAACTLAVFTIPFVPFVVAPEASTDSLQYQLLIPQTYLASGSIHRIPLLVEASYPGLAQHVYLPVLRLFGDAACKGLHFWIAGLVLVAIGRLSRAAWPQASPLLAPALFLAMPVAIVHAGWAWNDFTFTLMVLVALLFLVRHEATPPPERGRRELLGAGVMIGLASWTKYTFVLVLLALSLLFVVAAWRWAWRPRQVAAFAGGVWLVAPFWMIQNAILVRNPFYPFLNGIFGSPYWPEASARWFHEALRRFETPDWSAWTYVTFPYRLSVEPRIVETHPGILPLLLAPLLLLPAASPALRVLRAYAGCFVVAWLLIQTETRSMMTLFAVILVVGCGFIQQEDFPSRALAPLVKPLVAASVAACAWLAMVTTQHLFSPFDWFIGRESRDAYLLRTAESQPAYAWLNARDDVSGVLLVALHGPYYLEKPCLFGSFADPPAAMVILQGAGSVEGMRQRLLERGVTHVVVDHQRMREQVRGGLWSWPPAEQSLFERFLAEGCSPVAQFGADLVLRVR